MSYSQRAKGGTLNGDPYSIMGLYNGYIKVIYLGGP